MIQSITEIRKRWYSLLCCEGVDLNDINVKAQLDDINEKAQNAMKSMNLDDARTCVWDDIPDQNHPFNRDASCQRTVERLEVMARAYKTEGCALKGNSELLEKILSGLQFVSDNWYNMLVRRKGHWWNKEIGIPLVVNRICVLLYDEMPKKLLDAYIATVYSYTNVPHKMCIEDQLDPEWTTGANRVWKCFALAGCAIVWGDSFSLDRALHFLKPIFTYSTNRDGFYPDGSFVQHGKFAYNGGYGNSLLRNLVDYMEVLADTEWNIGGDELSMLLDWVKNSYEPFIYRGGLMGMVRGREISRGQKEDHVGGHEVITSLIMLACSLDAETSRELKSKIKAWILSDSYRDFFEHAPVSIIPRARAIMNDETIKPYKFPPSSHIFAGMDRVVHYRDSYAVGLSMNSERIAKYEALHNENLRGWYTSEGTIYLYNSDDAQFSDGYFATINAKRMPGTTVDTAEREARGYSYGHEPKMHTSLVGGTALGSLYSSVAMEIENECTDLSGMKSWFMFDDEIVCLGSNIKATTGREIETVVENRKIDDSAYLTVNGKKCDTSVAAKYGDIKTAHLCCADSKADIGYYFPKPYELELLSEYRTDCWRSVTEKGSTEPVTNRFASIVLSHGVDPTCENYEYVLLPAKSVDETEKYAESPAVEIIANNSSVQAVRHGKLSLLGANFLKDERCEIDKLCCDSKACVMVRESDERVEIALSEPTWKKDTVTLELDRAASEVVSADDGVEVLSLSPKLKLSINTKNAMGKTFEITVK